MEVTIELWVKSTIKQDRKISIMPPSKSSPQSEGLDKNEDSPPLAGLISIARFIMAARSLDLTRWVLEPLTALA